MILWKKNAIALTTVGLVFIALGIWLYSLNSRIKAVTDSQPEFARQNDELSRRLSLISEPEPGQAPAGYSPNGPGPFLATCDVCSGKVSSDAKACPHCGHTR